MPCSKGPEPCVSPGGSGTAHMGQRPDSLAAATAARRAGSMGASLRSGTPSSASETKGCRSQSPWEAISRSLASSPRWSVILIPIPMTTRVLPFVSKSDSDSALIEDPSSSVCGA